MSMHTSKMGNNVLAPIKMGVYLTVGLYASYAIIFGTTFFNEFQRIMAFAGILSIAVLIFMVWLGVAIKQKRKLEKN